MPVDEIVEVPDRVVRDAEINVLKKQLEEKIWRKSGVKHMNQVYKLTDQNLRTHGGFQWELGVWRETSGSGDLCGSGWLHFYTHPLLAVILNPIHAKITNPRLFEAEVDGEEKTDRGLKVGYTRARIVCELPLPVVTMEQRVKFAILCTKKVYDDITWNTWADKWLSGEDRTHASAVRAASAVAAYAANATYASDAAYHATCAADYFAAYHAVADAACATDAAAYAAADASADASAHAAQAAYAAAYAAYHAVLGVDWDLISIAKEATK